MDDDGKFDICNVTNTGWKKRRNHFGVENESGEFEYYPEGGSFISHLALGENLDRSIPNVTMRIIISKKSPEFYIMNTEYKNETQPQPYPPVKCRYAIKSIRLWVCHYR